MPRFPLACAIGLVACSSTPGKPDARMSAWSMGPTMPRPALEPGVAALGQQVVVVGGFDTDLAHGSDITTEADVYDTFAMTWSQTTPAPLALTHINLAAAGDTVYLLGGLEGIGFAARGDAFALDPLTHVWNPIAPLPAGQERGASGVVVALGHIYLIGGASTTAPLASSLDYDIAQNTWSQLPDLPAPRSHLAAMRRSDGTLIATGGLESLDASEPRGDTFWLPPPGAGPRVWMPHAPMHPPGDPDLHGGCAYGVVLGQLVCAGGESPQAARKNVDSYDPFNDVWSVVEPMPAPRAGTQGAAIGGRLFVPGGAPVVGSIIIAVEPTDTLFIYEPLDTASTRGLGSP